MSRLAVGCATVLAAVMLAAPAAAAADAYTITIKNHRFEPSEITIPAGEKVKLVVKNMDPTPEEFESYELNREKVIAGDAEATIYVGPLEPGTYPFFGEFNQDTAQGRIVVK